SPSDGFQSKMHLQNKMSNSLKRRSSASIDKMMCIDRCFPGGEPYERKRDVGPSFAKLDKCIERHPMQAHLGGGHYGEDRAVKKRCWEADNVSRQQGINDLSSSFV